MTDLISRQDAIALLATIDTADYTPEDVVSLCIEALTNMPSAETPDRCETGTEARDLLRYKP